MKNLPKYLIGEPHYGADDTYLVRLRNPLAFGVIGENDHRVTVRCAEGFQKEQGYYIPQKMLEIYHAECGTEFTRDAYEIIESNSAPLPEWLVCEATMFRADLDDYLFVVHTHPFHVIAFQQDDGGGWNGSLVHSAATLHAARHGAQLMREAGEKLNEYLTEEGNDEE